MIRHVAIEKLWGQYEMDWHPHPDVNILAGVNGSGKSTLLKILDTALSGGNNLSLRLPHLRALRITGAQIEINVTPEGSGYWKNECGCDFIGTFDEITYEKKALSRELSPLAAYLDALTFDTQRPSLNNYRLKAATGLLS